MSGRQKVSYSRLPSADIALLLPCKVGFKGTMLYASTFVIQKLLENDVIVGWIRDGKMLLCLWDDFNRYQEVVPNQASDGKGLSNDLLIRWAPETVKPCALISLGLILPQLSDLFHQIRHTTLSRTKFS